jgi:MipA family protein
MNRKLSATIFALAALSGFYPRPGFAQQSLDLSIETPGVRNFVGGALGAAPDYVGSNDYTLGIAPAAKVYFDASERYVRLIATELSANLLDSKTWSFGPLLNYRFGRSDVGDEVVKRMDDLDGAVELGGVGGWTWVGPSDPRQRLNLSLQYQHDVSGTHDGYLITPAVRYWHPVSRPVTISVGVSTTYGSKNYTSKYFDVTPADSARSGLPVFTASSGIRDVRISPVMIYSLSQQWHLSAGLIYSRLVGDAADSPIVATRGSADQLFGGLGVVYAW